MEKGSLNFISSIYYICRSLKTILLSVKFISNHLLYLIIFIKIFLTILQFFSQ